MRSRGSITAVSSVWSGPKCTFAYVKMLSHRPTSYLAGERATGLNPLNPITVLETLVMEVASRPLRPPMTSELRSLDMSLLNSSPPDGTELRQAKTLFNAQVYEATGFSSLAKRIAKRMIRALETTQSELGTVRNELAEH
jgi:hypothetical protein